MSFRWTNKQPEIQSFEIYAVTIKISMTEYHHWINRLTIYSNTAVYGEKFSHLWSTEWCFELQFFFRASVLLLIKDTDRNLGTCSSDFSEWKHCLAMPLRKASLFLMLRYLLLPTDGSSGLLWGVPAGRWDHPLRYLPQGISLGVSGPRAWAGTGRQMELSTLCKSTARLIMKRVTTFC